MYCNYYGFSEKPFDVTPDPKYLFLTSTHQEIMAAIIYGIRERSGFITVIGEVGTGKTTLLHAVQDRLPSSVKLASIFNTALTFKQMLLMALVDLGLLKSIRNVSKAEAIQRLNEFAIQQLSTGGNLVLMVDEAQNLTRQALDDFRLLSNLETSKHKLVQIVLCGQPELETKLNHTDLRQLAQRISLKRYAEPLSRSQTLDYVGHRLKVANYTKTELFDAKALQLIWENTGGIPRMINILCDNALLIGYALEKKKIKEPILKEAIRDISWSPFWRTHVEQTAQLSGSEI